jgi:hypothetical protein
VDRFVGKWNSFSFSSSVINGSRWQNIRGNAFCWRQDFFFTGQRQDFFSAGFIFIVGAPSDTGLKGGGEDRRPNRLSIDFSLKGSFKPTLMEGFGKGRIQPLQEIRWKKTHPQMDTEPIVK